MTDQKDKSWSPLIPYEGKIDDAFKDKLSAYIADGGDLKIKDEKGGILVHLLGNPSYDESKHLKMVAFLIEQGADALEASKSTGWSPLHVATDRNQVKTMGLLLENGANPNSPTMNDKDDWLMVGWTPLHIAARNSLPREPDAMRLLLEKGADINARATDGSTALHQAAGHGNINAVKLLHEKGADANAAAKDGSTPLNSAVASTASPNQTQAVKVLLEHGADPNVLPAPTKVRAGPELVTQYGRTPLQAAADLGNTEMVKLLLENGADVNAKNDALMTPLLFSAARGHSKTMEQLVASGADVNATNKFGMTALHMVADDSDAVNAVKMLISNGADVNVKDEGSRTPLHDAALRGNLAAMKLLIENGARLNTKDGTGLTPIGLLEKHETPEKAAEMKEELKQVVKNLLGAATTDEQRANAYQGLAALGTKSDDGEVQTTQGTDLKHGLDSVVRKQSGISPTLSA